MAVIYIRNYKNFELKKSIINKIFYINLKFKKIYTKIYFKT
jgi:hypothetical protein